MKTIITIALLVARTIRAELASPTIAEWIEFEKKMLDKIGK